ncbi:MAG TPA: hypothetical protein VMV95_03990 [Bacillota bacterium]|nr:hypothetical protein [Bacillota bacterium]
MVEQTKQPVQQAAQPTGTAQPAQMGQQTQVQAQTTQAKPGTPAEIPTGTQPDAKPVKKKSKWWIWLIIAVVVIGIAAAIYFIL